MLYHSGNSAQDSQNSICWSFDVPCPPIPSATKPFESGHWFLRHRPEIVLPEAGRSHVTAVRLKGILVTAIVSETGYPKMLILPKNGSRNGGVLQLVPSSQPFPPWRMAKSPQDHAEQGLRLGDGEQVAWVRKGAAKGWDGMVHGYHKTIGITP